MIKLIALFEHEIDGKVGRFYMDHDTPISSAKEMGFAFMKYLGNVEDQAKAQQEKAKQENEQKTQSITDTPTLEESHVE